MTAELVLHVQEDTFAGSKDPRTPPVRSVAKRVTRLTIGPSWIAYDEKPGHTVVLDFVGRCRRTIDRTARTYVDDPLFAVVAHRHMELPNLAHVRDVLAGGGMHGTDFSALFVEHQLAIKDPSLESTLGRQESARTRWWSFSAPPRPSPSSDIQLRLHRTETVAEALDERMLSHSQEGPREPHALRGYTQFLRYRYGGHPLLLEYLASQDFVPSDLFLHALAPRGLGLRDVSLELESVRAGAVTQPDIDGFRDLNSSVVRPGDAALDAETGIAEVLRALASGNALEGLLSFFELTLETDVAMPPEVGTLINGTSDDGVKMLLMALASVKRPGDKSGVVLGLQAFAELASVVKTKKHVLWALEAGLRTASGDAEAAKVLLLRAIEVNPRLTAAHTELGYLFLREYDATKAWRCWMTARSLAPGHPALRSVAAFEQKLLTSHPEYFAI